MTDILSNPQSSQPHLTQPHLTQPHLTQPHLTQDELDDVILGAASPAAHSHLSTCEQCRAEIAPFQSALTAFNESSLAWAEAKSNTISRDLSGMHPSGSGRQRAWSLGAAMLAAAALVVSVSVTHSPRTPTAAPAAVSQAQPGNADNAQEIADDNAMLNAINSEIHPVEPSPLQQFRPTRTPAGAEHHNPPREVRD